MYAFLKILPQNNIKYTKLLFKPKFLSNKIYCGAQLYTTLVNVTNILLKARSALQWVTEHFM